MKIEIDPKAYKDMLEYLEKSDKEKGIKTCRIVCYNCQKQIMSCSGTEEQIEEFKKVRNEKYLCKFCDEEYKIKQEYMI